MGNDWYKELEKERAQGIKGSAVSVSEEVLRLVYRSLRWRRKKGSGRGCK